jgi:FlaA1/EpsC-like NDP-sugar epimerase
MWRYTSIADLINIIKATFVSSPTIVLIILFFYHFIGFSRGVFIIDAFLTILFISGVRLSIRLFLQEASTPNNPSRFYFFKKMKEGLKRVLIIGAGDAGEMLLREMKQNPKMAFDPIGFLDDDPDKKGRRIHNVPVLGKIEEVEKIVQKKNVQEIIIAIPSITGKGMRGIVDQCKRAGISCKTVPAVSDILNEKVHVSQIREIRIEDLLGREHIELNRKEIEEYLSNKKVLVTGAGGSIGSELCRQILKIHPRQLILYERVENELFHLEMKLLETFPGAPYVSILGDIFDRKRLEDVMRDYRPEVVFHAAAYKHVPMMEAHPLEAIKNNILGTQNVAEVSAQWGVEKFVMISTDKAVNPVNVMGATKRLAELICQGMNQSQMTKYVVVRFGNVLNSAGSVIPIFKEQIAKGGPLTVTHFEATRYFMSIPEASQLVMQAGAMGKGGEIFVLDMGKPIRITDLAMDMVRLMGLKIGEDIDIVYSGLRPGEKIHEELVTDEEEVEPTGNEKIMMVKSPPFDWIILKKKIEELVKNLNHYNPEEVKEILISMVIENQRSFTQNHR